MSGWPWRSPEASRRALADRIASRYPPGERARRLREVAYRRLLARIFEAQPERWVVKGGAALLLRLDPNRTSNDIDLTYVEQGGEYAVALRALAEASALDLGDFFHFEIGAAAFVETDHPLERSLSVPVVARVGEREFARFSIDLALPRSDVAVEWVEDHQPLTGLEIVDGLPPIATVTFAAQLADKTCALFELHGSGDTHSSRARDLADIAMIAKQIDVRGDDLQQRVRIEEDRRLAAGTLKRPLPESLVLADEQLADWSGRWAKATRGAPIGLDEALEIAARLLDPILARRVDGSTWIAARGAWEP